MHNHGASAEQGWATLISRVQQRLPDVGWRTGRLRSRPVSQADAGALEDAILELIEHVESSDERITSLERLLADAPPHAGRAAAWVARSVGLALVDFAAKVGPGGEAANLRDCYIAADGLIGHRREPSYGELLAGIQSVLDEVLRRAKVADVELHVLEDEWADRIDESEGRLDSMVEDLAMALGATDLDPELDVCWPDLLDEVRRLVEPSRAPCPVPGCYDLVVKSPRPSRAPGEWPVDLCRHHIRVRFERFQARLALEMPDHAGPIHAAGVPLPSLAHLAAAPEALRDPPPS
jgi:hypothetical protein